MQRYLNYQADARRFLVESKNLKTLMPKVIAGVRAIVESSLVGSLSMEVLELTRERVDPEDELTLLDNTVKPFGRAPLGNPMRGCWPSCGVV